MEIAWKDAGAKMLGVRFSFGDLLVDTERYVVERDGRAVDVQPQVFDVLAYLLEHRDRLVPKEELLDEVWGDRFVSESALTSRIKSARQLVGDNGLAQACIKTLHGRGYRWIADVEVAPSAIGAADPADHPTNHRAPGGTGGAPIAPPVPLTSLVGRHTEIAAVRAALAGGRLTTALGPPGVGKSRLAIEVARVAFPAREVAFADLRLIDHGDDVARIVRRAIGAGEGSAPHEIRGTVTSGAGLEALVEHLRARAMLLVLDNCEHVVESVAQLCIDLLTQCPDVAVLATSRCRLGVVGESVVSVEPLASPEDGRLGSWLELSGTDAGRLFIERSTAAGARWAESPAEAELIAEVCRRLDGLPLAIELAATRARWLGLPDVLRHLDRELGEDVGDPLPAALRMSRALLGPHEAKAFDALSVFAGSFTIDAALAVIDAVCSERDALAVFGHLVDHSLISVIDAEPRRYRLLETVQRFADACRRAGNDPLVPVAAHARFYLHFVESHWPNGRIAADAPWALLDAEMTEVLAAIDTAIDGDPSLARRLLGAVGWYWSLGGYAEQCERLAARLADDQEIDAPSVQAAFLWARSNARLLLGLDPVESATRAHALALEAASWSVAGWSLAHVIAPDMMWADLPVVEARWPEIVDLFRRANDPLGEAWAMVFVLGWAEACAQLHARATATYSEAAELFERHGDLLGSARALLEIVELNTWSGDDLDAARAAFKRIPPVEDASVDFRMKYLWLEGLVAGAEGDWASAIQRHSRALELGERSVPGSILVNTYRCLLARTMRSAGRTGDAAARLLGALAAVPKRSPPRSWAAHSAWVVESAAGLLAEAGAAEPAARLMAAAHGLRVELDAPMPYWDRPRFEPDLQRVRRQLGADGFEAARARGIELDLDGALRLAREELSALTDRSSE